MLLSAALADTYFFLYSRLDRLRVYKSKFLLFRTQGTFHLITFPRTHARRCSADGVCARDLES